jgi:hypothetical protein
MCVNGALLKPLEVPRATSPIICIPIQKCSLIPQLIALAFVAAILNPFS